MANLLQKTLLEVDCQEIQITIGAKLEILCEHSELTFKTVFHFLPHRETHIHIQRRRESHESVRFQRHARHQRPKGCVGFQPTIGPKEMIKVPDKVDPLH